MIIDITPAMEEQLLQLEYLEIALTIGASWWFPFIESIHVLAATLMLGLLLMVDLRLLGVAAKRYGVETILTQQLPWVWLGFVTALISGVLMFMTNALAYAMNPAMQLKLLLIFIAGINTLLVHWALRRNNRHYSTFTSNISAKRLTLTSFCGALSLTLWVSVIIAGRWIGHIQ